jgi:hypothetical protein
LPVGAHFVRPFRAFENHRYIAYEIAEKERRIWVRRSGMNFPGSIRARVVAGIAACLAAAAIGVLVIGLPRGPKPQAPDLAALQPAPRLDTSIPQPAVQDVILEPRPAPRPGANARLDSPFPPSRLPDVATVAGARFSLSCLAKNGADLTKPMPSKHHVFAADETAASQLRAWAQANGFEVRNTLTLASHTGKPEIQFDLVRVEVPDPQKVEDEGRLVLAAVQQIPGTFYQTWSGEIVH